MIRGQGGDSEVNMHGKEVVVQMTARGRDLIDMMAIQSLSNGAVCVLTKRQDRSSCRAKWVYILLTTVRRTLVYFLAPEMSLTGL